MEKKKTTEEEYDLSYYLGGTKKIPIQSLANKKTSLSLNGKWSGSRKKEHP